jgi:uncharacterized protein
LARLTVRLTPRGGADRVDGVDEQGNLRVRVRAAPVDGAANAALVALLAGALSVPRTAVTVERGTASRIKTVRIEGLGDAALTAFVDGFRRRRG